MGERELVFAAWIANLARFYEPGPEQFARRCEPILSRYLDTRLLLEILENREGRGEMRKLVDEAFRLSLCESEVREKTANGRHLTSVFSRVTVKDGDSCPKRYYDYFEESPDAAFPSEAGFSGNLSELAGRFEEEFLSLRKNPPESWEHFVVVFDSLMRKYMWCITASDYEGEDISLYNQSRIAAAIACCMARQPEDPHAFKLVVGDFSGIQKYVFSVARVSEKGVSKRLRARSFHVDITVSVLAQEILYRFGLTQNHILLQAGGKFYLLLPNTPDSDGLLEQIEKETEAVFFSLFKGQIAIHLAWLAMGAEGLENYSKTVTRIMRMLGKKKSQSFFHCLANGTGWNTDAFVLEQNLADRHICSSCGGELVKKGEIYCENCQMQTQIGGLLPKIKYISYYRGEKAGTFPIFGDYRIGLWTELRKDNAFLVEQLYDGAAAAAGNIPLRVRYMANHIPVDDHQEVMTFEDIAEAAHGVKRLAVLKADVDNLGYIFADGLRTAKRHFGTLSRINTMSRFLEIFFSGYINQMISTDPRFTNVYSVFSGGDDLFLIGPWDVMPELACKINSEFRQFAAGNPSLSLSAAISVFYPKEHIANLAEYSEQALKRVKNSTNKALYPEKEGRDGVSFMGELYSWEDLGQQLRIGKRIAGLMMRQMIPVSLLRRIGTYSRMYRSFLIDKDVMGLMFEPLFYYDRQRNYDAVSKMKGKEQEIAWFLDEYIRDLSANAADLRVVKKNLYFAETAGIYALNYSKEERV